MLIECVLRTCRAAWTSSANPTSALQPRTAHGPGDDDRGVAVVDALADGLHQFDDVGESQGGAGQAADVVHLDGDTGGLESGDRIEEIRCSEGGATPWLADFALIAMVPPRLKTPTACPGAGAPPFVESVTDQPSSGTPVIDSSSCAEGGEVATGDVQPRARRAACCAD
jgi:hypothetical protein